MENSEHRVLQLYIPKGEDYVTHPNLVLLAMNRSLIQTADGLGLPSTTFVEYRSPSQNGTTVVNSYKNIRPVTFTLMDSFFDILQRERSVDRLKKAVTSGTNLNPLTKEFRPLILRDTFWPTGKHRIEGSNAVYNATTNILTVPYAGFVTWGGFNPLGGDTFFWGTFQLRTLRCLNDFQIDVGDIPFATEGVPFDWYYIPNSRYKESFLALQDGPTQPLTDVQVQPYGYQDTLNFIAHNPFWYGAEQYFECTIQTIGDLVYDGEGAWYGENSRWLFEEENIKCEFTVYYEGSHRSRPIVEIYGPVARTVLSNITSGVTIEYLGGIEVAQGVRIDFQNNTVIDLTTGENLSQYLSGPQTLFGIETNYVAPDGENEFLILLDQIEPETRVIFKWRNVYG